MEQFHHGTGIIKYDPHRGDMRNRTKWWAVVDVDRDITRYYRWWLKKEYHLILEQPAWDAHISIFRGEPACGQHPGLWKKYQNKRVDFLYEHGNIRCEPDKKNGGHYYWVDVECPFLSEMRSEMELPVGWKFHITIGRTYY
jgi:hypothetical protein